MTAKIISMEEFKKRKTTPVYELEYWIQKVWEQTQAEEKAKEKKKAAEKRMKDNINVLKSMEKR